MKSKHLIRTLALALAACLFVTAALAEGTFYLPSGLTAIGAEAFRSSNADSFVLPEGLKKIESRAFSEVDVQEINLPSTLTYIAEDAFERMPGKIFADPDSYAYDWCTSRGWQPLGRRAASLGTTQTTLRAGQHMMYSFTAPTVGLYEFCSTGELDTYGILYDADMTELTRNDDGGENRNFRIYRTLTAGQRVTLEVYLYSSSASGSFPLCIRQTSRTASLGTNPTTLSAGQHLTYIFTAPYAAEYSFCSTGELDTYGILYNTGMTVLARNDDGGENKNFSISYTLTAGQQVFLEVYFYASSTSGSFPVYIRQAAQTASLGVNQTTLSAGQHLLYRFTAPAARTYDFYSTGELDTYGILYDANMSELARNDDSENRNFHISRALSAGEEVYLEVYLYSSSATGSFPLYIRQAILTASLGTNPTTLVAGEHLMYSFTAPANAEYDFYSTGSLDTYGILYDANMEELARNDDGENRNFCINRTLTAGQQVFLEVYLYSSSTTGSFPVCIDQYILPDPSSSNFRALIIGNVYDESPNISTLTGCDGDRAIMSNLLTRSVTRTPYNVTVRRNLTASQILSAIPAAFSGADSNSVSLFFYSGHGFTGSGELVGTDRKGVSYAALKKALDAVPGKKIVLLNCCYSGNAIGKADGAGDEAAALTTADLDAINRRVISTFASPVEKSGELAASNYYVLTAASKDQPSWSNSRYGYFTYCLAYGSGWNGGSGSRLSTLYADSNGDGNISLKEAHAWVEYQMDEFRNTNVQQRTQIYPSNSSFVLWGR